MTELREYIQLYTMQIENNIYMLKEFDISKISSTDYNYLGTLSLTELTEQEIKLSGNKYNDKRIYGMSTEYSFNEIEMKLIAYHFATLTESRYVDTVFESKLLEFIKPLPQIRQEFIQLYENENKTNITEVVTPFFIYTKFMPYIALSTLNSRGNLTKKYFTNLLSYDTQFSMENRESVLNDIITTMKINLITPELVNCTLPTVKEINLWFAFYNTIMPIEQAKKIDYTYTEIYFLLAQQTELYDEYIDILRSKNKLVRNNTFLANSANITKRKKFLKSDVAKKYLTTEQKMLLVEQLTEGKITLSDIMTTLFTKNNIKNTSYNLSREVVDIIELASTPTPINRTELYNYVEKYPNMVQYLRHLATIESVSGITNDLICDDFGHVDESKLITTVANLYEVIIYEIVNETTIKLNGLPNTYKKHILQLIELLSVDFLDMDKTFYFLEKYSDYIIDFN